MSDSEMESTILQQLLPELQAEGFEVYLNPKGPLLPQFLKGYIPDAIALRRDKNLAIEVVGESPIAQKKIEKITGLFAGHPDWELRVVLATPAILSKRLQIQSATTIRKRIAEVRELATQGHFGPALLLAWATFEALGRALLTKQFQRPQTPGRLVQLLAGSGHLTPSEADTLRLLADKRNQFIHGELQTRITKAEVRRFADVLDTMLKMVGNKI